MLKQYCKLNKSRTVFCDLTRKKSRQNKLVKFTTIIWISKLKLDTYKEMASNFRQTNSLEIYSF